MTSTILALHRYEPYLLHWLDYHLNSYNIDHIYLLDNNDEGDELKLPNAYKSYVTIFPINHVKSIFNPIETQSYLYNQAYYKLKDDYDVNNLLVIDIDEYFYSEKYNNINDLVSDYPYFSNCWKFDWVNYDDNDYIYLKDLPYDNPVSNYTRITYVADCSCLFSQKTLIGIRPNFNFTLGIHHHFRLDVNNKVIKSIYHISDKIARINHYRTGCVEAYIDKIRLRRISDSEVSDYGNKNVQFYFTVNKITNEKLDAFIALYKKYNMIMSDSDKKFIEDNYIK